MLKLVFPTQYLVNQLMDFDQTCTEALLREGSELVRFCDLDLMFKVVSP